MESVMYWWSAIDYGGSLDCPNWQLYFERTSIAIDLQLLWESESCSGTAGYARRSHSSFGFRLSPPYPPCQLELGKLSTSVWLLVLG